MVWIGLLILGMSVAGFAQAPGQTRIDYGRDIRPILSENCFHCHGQDSKKRMAGLRLDTFAGASEIKGKRTALVPGDADASSLYQRIAAEHPARRMPPVSSNRSLTAEQVSLIKRWIEEGGAYSQHWSFVPPVKSKVPEGSSDWQKNEIDAFVEARLAKENLKPNRVAPSNVWLRRVSLDLTGLPPAPEEFAAFEKSIQSKGETAYEAVVDRLLASPRYGERMAIDWLDVARYADTHGFNNDSSRSMWRWRDWVIDSFNENKPYDRFLTEQLAGDLLPQPTLNQRIATGFGRNHVINSEGGIIEEEYRVEYVSDRVRTLGMSWLGLTLECARCHDHKYDPIGQKDHYKFFAFFNNVPELGEDGRVANAVPLLSAPTREQQLRMQQIEAEFKQIQPEVNKSIRGWKWKSSDGPRILQAVDQIQLPTDAVLKITCESTEGIDPKTAASIALKPGIQGNACSVGNGAEMPMTAEKSVPVSKRDPLSFSAWINPAETDKDVALFSAIDYNMPTSAVLYGRGIEVRLAEGELEFRFSDRFPAYSIRVRSNGAKLEAGQWRHVALVYEGVAGNDPSRADASWVRMFIDGQEVSSSVLNEGVAISDAKAKPTLTTFRIGWDNRAGSSRYQGLLDEVAFWKRRLTEAEISSLFHHDAMPYTVARHQGRTASEVEAGWVREWMIHHSNGNASKLLPKFRQLQSERLALLRKAPTVMVMEELPQPRETHILLRGVYNAPGDVVEPGVPEKLLGAWPEGAPKNRLGLAQWLTKPDHPLTARVVVNRFWQQLFGTGLVKTSDNFGLQSEWPSHPELLDLMAVEFIESGWDVKALIRRMVLSATYRQDSAGSPELFARDPENRLLARGPRFRLPAEILRDQALMVSGLLKNHVGGPSVYPYQPVDLYKGIVVAADYPGTKYVESTGDDLYRRSLYTFWKRTVPHPTMTVFDAPDREFCIVRRSATNTPLQALTLLNDPIYVEAARKLAERAIREGGATPQARLEYGFRLATGRMPNAEELGVLLKTFDGMLADYRADEASAEALIQVGASRRSVTVSASELAAYMAVSNMILNMDEVVTKG